MIEIFKAYIQPFLEDPKLFFIPVLLVALTHWFATRRKIDELLFNSRREIFGEFMKEYGGLFHPTKIKIPDFLDETSRKYERHQKMAHIMSQCRLVSGYFLEGRLRDLFDLINESEDKNKFNEKELKLKEYERVRVGLEVEALMRKNLRAIGWISLLLQLVCCFVERYSVKTLLFRKKYLK